MCSEGKKQTNKHTFWNSGLFLSADLLPETESSRDELVCLRGGDVGVYIRARLTWMFESERRERRILSFLYIYFSCIWGEYSWRFRLFYLRVCEERWQRPGRERTPFILEKHIISLLLWLYRNKRRPFAVSNDTLFLSVQSKLTRVFLVLFAVKENSTGAGFDTKVGQSETE